MQVIPEIKFHDVDRSPWVVDYVTDRLSHLDRFAGGGITSCHVTLAQEGGSHHKGNLYSVMVEVRMPPNHDLAATKKRAVHKMPEELRAVINQAFGAIENQVKKPAQLRRGEG